ncbi:MAG TPA: translocation/assembly module TamB domain-containing protein, partial [Steroidobacteraceae bacterium]|nr:translocation/assembly module TamB domain-containing protein [Steroidobacteraceae bacterium]
MRKLLHGAAWALGGVLLLALLLVLSLLILGNTAAGRRLLAQELSTLTSGKVQVVGLAGRFPSALQAARLQLSDSQGVWLTAEDISLHWAPVALLRSALHIHQLQIGHAEVLRRPISAGASVSRSVPTRHLPSIDIDQLSIATLALDPAVAGSRAIVTVHGQGHYRTLQDAQADVVVRRTQDEGDYHLAVALAPAGIEAHLHLQEPASGPLEHLLNLPGLGALAVEASIAGPRTAERLQLLARVGALSASANGTVDLRSQVADLDLALDSPPLAPAPGLSWKRIALQARVRGTLARPQVNGNLELAGLILPDGAQLGSFHASASADEHALHVQGQATDLLLPPPLQQLPLDAPLTLVGTLGLDAPDRPLELTVTQRLLALQAHVATQGPRSASFQVHLPDLAPIAALYGQQLRGTMTLAGTVRQAGELIGGELNGVGRLAGPSPAARLLGAHARLHLAGALNGPQLNLQELTLTGDALNVHAEGSAQRSTSGEQGTPLRALHASWRVTVPKLALIFPQLAGSLDTSGTAEGPWNALTTDVRARSTVAMRGGPPGSVSLSLKARGLPSMPSGTVQADGVLDGAPLRLDAAVDQLSSGLYRVVIHHATWKSLSADGDLAAGTDLAATRGQLRLRIDRLADFQSLVGSTLAGSLAASVKVMPSGRRQPRAQFDLSADQVRYQGIVANARLSGAGPLSALRIQLSAASPSVDGSPASVSASAQLDGVSRALQLDAFQMRYHGQTVQQLCPSRVVFARGLAVRNLRLAAGRATMAVDGSFSPTMNFRASIHQLDARLVDAFEPGLLEAGTLNADAQIHGKLSSPVGRASLRIEHIKLAAASAQGLPAADVRATASLAGASGEVSLQLMAGSASKLSLMGRVPLNSRGSFAVRLMGQLDLALMNPILATQGRHAAGILTMAASANGTVSAPRISGTVQLAKGDLRDYTEGVHIGDINAQLVGAQGLLKIRTLTARAGPGALSMTGTVGVLQPGMPLDITLKGQRIQPITNDILTANLNTDLHVAGKLRQQLQVSGNVRINRAAINIPNGFPPSVAVLDVRVPGQKQPSGASTGQIPIGLAIAVSAPDAIFVQGRGLDAQLAGNLRISGTSAKPQVNGAFNMVRGVYALAGTNIRFTSGRVSFNGEGLKDKIDPTLDFLAQASVTYNGAPTVVNLTVTGFADSPRISLSSTPPLPQDDLLALLLFGQPASQLTALQLAETGAALASLSGIGAGSSGGGGHSLNPLTWIKRALRLNSFSVGSAAPPSGSAPGGGSTISGAS